MREWEEMEDAKSRMIFDWDKGEMDLTRRRATDLKQNSRVFFPKKTDLDTESKLTMLRVEALAIVDQFRKEKCIDRDQQKSNISAAEARGLKSLRTRVREGEIVVLPTDKTGRFAVMSRDSYERAGLIYTQGDKEVNWDMLRKEQREINGHGSMPHTALI